MARVKIKKYKGQYYRHQFYVNGREARQEILFPKPTTEKQFITCRNKIDNGALEIWFALKGCAAMVDCLDDKMRAKLRKLVSSHYDEVKTCRR